MADAQNLIRQSENLFNKTERINSENMWNELTKYIMPNQFGVFHGNQGTEGSKKTNGIFDSTPIHANVDLASSMHATLTNPSTKWSKLRYKSDELNNDSDSTAWLQAATDAIHSFLNESNFDTQASRNYNNYSALGNMVLFHDSKRSGNKFDGFIFKALHLSEIAFSENAEGIVDVLYRKFKLTVRQAVEMWGNKLDKKYFEMLETQPEKRFEFLHCVGPRDPKEVRLNDAGLAPGDRRPYYSVYIDIQQKQIIDEDGYYEFPFYVTRWQTMTGEVYGRGPGHTALPDIMTLNKVRELSLRAAAKMIDPPMITTMQNVIGNLDIRPQSASVVRNINDIKELSSVSRIDVTQFELQDLRNAIKSTFFLDKLLLPPRTETGEMTAHEIERRLEQMQRVLGPTLSRLNSEFLSPLIIRAFKILLRENMLPQAPELVQRLGVDIDITFVNQLSRAQQTDEINNIRRWIQESMELAQLNPQALDYVNADAIIKFIAKTRGVPESAVMNDKDVQALREERAKAQQAQLALQSAQVLGDVAAKTGVVNEPPTTK
jgi:hypothetical protein